MKALTGIVAAAALSFAAGAKADEQAEDNVVRHANVAYSVGYLGGYDFQQSGALEGFTASAHFVPYEFIEDGLYLGIDVEASIYALLGDEADVMTQQKAVMGLEAPTEVVALFPYLGVGFSAIGLQSGYFTLCQGMDFNFGQNGETAPYLGLEHGWLFDGDDTGYYAVLNIGLKI
ncbi:MAG: hypothetical protein AABX27_02675 [Nanoarchaeota archaeon]